MRSLSLVVALAVLATAPLAAAQDDDWAITRPDHGTRTPRPRPRATHPRPGPVASERTSSPLIDRYRAMVERDPSESFALARWVTLAAERDGSTAPLTAEMQHAASDPAALVPRLV